MSSECCQSHHRKDQFYAEWGLPKNNGIAKHERLRWRCRCPSFQCQLQSIQVWLRVAWLLDGWQVTTKFCRDMNLHQPWEQPFCLLRFRWPCQKAAMAKGEREMLSSCQHLYPYSLASFAPCVSSKSQRFLSSDDLTLLSLQIHHTLTGWPRRRVRRPGSPCLLMHK